MRLLDVNTDALEIEVFIYIPTTDWDEYLAIREELLLAAMRIIEEEGLRLAPPTERHEVIQATKVEV